MTRISSITQVSPGQSVPEYARTIDTQDLVKYAAATDDYARQHWDHLFMLEMGFPGVIVHGWFTFGLMCEAVGTWISPEIADVVSYSVRYHRPTFPGPVVCGGEVASVGADGRAELKLWAKDGEGLVTTTAAVTLAFA